MNDSPGLFRRTPKTPQHDERRTYPSSYTTDETQQDEDPRKYLGSAEDRERTEDGRNRDVEANRAPGDDDDDIKEKIIKVGDKEMPLSQLLAEAREKYGTREGEVQVQHLNYSSKLKQQVGQKTLKNLVVRKKAEKIEKHILKDMSFVLAPGEMTLLLGGPGSGKTSLLDILANRRGVEGITGKVLLNGKRPVAETYNKDVSYVVQGDYHEQRLTVYETLLFAAALQLKPQDDIERKEQLDRRVEIVMQILGLAHRRDSIVGGPLLRGISGGEKRRLTIGVELVKGPKFNLLDEPTTGLDSATALSIGRSIRQVAEVFRTPVLCALLQPSYELMCEFDKLLIISKGEIAYWGPRTAALEYFEKLGFPCPKNYNAAEFLSEIVDHADKFNKEDEENQNEKKTREYFIDSWNKSTLKRQMFQKYFPPGFPVDPEPEEKTNPKKKQGLLKTEKKQNPENLSNSSQQNSNRPLDPNAPPPPSHIDGRVPNNAVAMNVRPVDPNAPAPNPKGEKKRKIKREEIYAAGFMTQLRYCLWRGVIVQKRDLSKLAIQLGNQVIIAVIIGTFFLFLSYDLADSRARLGLVFFALVRLGFGSLASVPTFFEKRTVYTFQKKARYYGTLPYWISETVLQFPFAIAEVLFFGTIIYWLGGLAYDGTRYLFFLFVLLWVFLVGDAYGKAISAAAPSPVMASLIASSVLGMLILFSGFLIRRGEIALGWLWAPYVSFFYYGTNALVINEFYGYNLTCTENELSPPSNSALLNVPYPEGFSGFQVCQTPTGVSFLHLNQFYDQFYLRWVMFAAVVGWYLVFGFLYFLALKYVRGGGKRVVILQEEDEDVKKVEENAQKSDKKDKKTAKGILTFKDVVYTVKGDTVLLNGVSGYVKPGMMLALMGPSGAGKSTLLDVLAKRKTGGKIDGEILLNDSPPEKFYHRYIGYVEQFDVLYPYATVLETLQFCAKARLPAETSKEDMDAIVQKSMELLDLKDITGSLIGLSGEPGALSLEQRKRVSIGCEFVANPRVLFLDEPTTGLDSNGADRVCDAMKAISEFGTSLICTIHQPSTRIFSRFSHLLLLNRNGREVYFGKTGKDSEEVLEYFENLGKKIPQHKNPADVVLDFVDDDEGQDYHPIEQFQESKQHEELEQGISDKTDMDDTGENFKKVYALNFFQQFKLLFMRNIIGFYRRPGQLLFTVIRSLIIGLIFGSVFDFLPKTPVGATERVSLIFFACLMANLTAFSYLYPSFAVRPLFYRERAEGMYRTTAFVLARSLSNLPAFIIEAFIFVTPLYWIAGFQPHASNYFFFVFAIILLYLCGVSAAEFVGSVMPNPESAGLIFGSILAFYGLCAGFLRTRNDIPIWYIWGYWLSFFHYVIEALVVNEFTGLELGCKYNADAVAVPITLQDGTNVTKYYCPYNSGEDFMTGFQVDPSMKWFDMLILFGWALFFVFLTIVCNRFVNFNKR